MTVKEVTLDKLDTRIRSLCKTIENRIAFWGKLRYNYYLKTNPTWQMDEDDLTFYKNIKILLG